MTTVEQDNRRILSLLSEYLNNRPDFIDAGMMQEMSAVVRSEREAYSLLLSVALGLDIEDNPEDKTFYGGYFPQMIRPVSYDKIMADPYLKAVRFKPASLGEVSLEYQSVAPYEAFVEDDMLWLMDGRRVPQIGFFNREYRYPALTSGGRLWMSVTPNEINTMKEPVSHAEGNVLTFGLGLGYYAFLASNKENVTSVTCVEHDPDVIALFEQVLLPSFPARDKIRIVEDDAFAFAEREFPTGRYDSIFTDLWHDAGDGLPLYQQMKALEPLAPDAIHDYWIEKTLSCYVKELPDAE